MKKKKTNILVHLAAETGTGQSMYENARYVKANCLSTSYIVDYIGKGNHNIEILRNLQNQILKDFQNRN